MPRIYVDFAGLDQIGSRCKAVSSRVDSIQSDFRQTVRRLDWDISFESDINTTAKHLSRKLEQYSKALEAYQRFIKDAGSEYSKLDEYIVSTENSRGSILKFIGGLLGITSWADWGKNGVALIEKVATIATDYNKYKKNGNAIGVTKAKSCFLKKCLGLTKIGRVSTAKSPCARFFRNLTKKSSPYKLSGAFDSFIGKNGVVSTVASWGGVVLSGISNLESNLEEQDESNGTMSSERVLQETVTETVIETVATHLGTAIVGSAISAATGVVAAPILVAAATGATIYGINAVCKEVTGSTATEHISDFFLDNAPKVGNAVCDGTKKAANWFRKALYA